MAYQIFTSMLKYVVLHWFIGLPPKSVTSFEDLASRFTAQFSINRGKKIVLSNTLVLHQGKNEPLKNFLSRFNKMTVQVNEPDDKFFVFALLKSLRTETFKEAFFIEKLVTMEEIRTRAEKHIDAEEATVLKKARDNKVDHERKQKGGWNDQKPSKVPSAPDPTFHPFDRSHVTNQ